MRYAYDVIEERAAEAPEKLFLQFEDRKISHDESNRGINRVADAVHIFAKE